jgi:hypothetical protein
MTSLFLETTEIHGKRIGVVHMEMRITSHLSSYNTYLLIRHMKVYMIHVPMKRFMLLLVEFLGVLLCKQ